jgi:thioredoxin-like negative regulator of GroEL
VNQYVEVCRTIGEAQQEYFPIYGGVPSGVWGPLLNNKEALAEAINRRQENVQAQKGILNGLAISESEAKRRFLASSADVEASIALARHSASRGDFGSAFRTLVQTAELDKRRAFEVRETFLQLFEACENREMVSVFRRQLGMLLHP